MPDSSLLLLENAENAEMPTSWNTFKCLVHTRSRWASARCPPPTLAAGALAAVDDGQHDRLALSAPAPQAEEPDRVVRVQAVAAALAHRLQVRLLGEMEGGERGVCERKIKELEG